MAYFKPNTKKAIKLATAVKGITATLAASTFIIASAEASIIVLIVGAVANEAINFLSDSENPNTPI